MNHTEFNLFCQSLPASTYSLQWRGAHVWKVGGKVFAVGGLNAAKQPTYSFKTSTQNFDFLSQHPSCQPAPYLAARGGPWIQYLATSETSSADLKLDALQYYLTQSHRWVVLSLSKAKQQALGVKAIDSA
jgi:predicted DNA-binding protein (MmcQ/YjbR family)